MITHFSLFTGIGGIDLSAEWAGFETVGQCEFADYPTKVLEKHWPDVPRWRDIRSVTAESFMERTGRTTVDLVSGGFPCQPFSVAGKRKGKDDDRYLWPEMLRVISELRPTWVLGENVAGIVNMALDQVLSDLESQGYETQAFIIPACAVDARHRRDRCFIVGNSNGMRVEGTRTEQQATRISGTSENVANSTGERLQREWTGREQVARIYGEKALFVRNSGNKTEWQAEPDVGRVANGIPSRVDRLKCLGNAVVPQQVYPILQAIAEIERNMNQ